MATVGRELVIERATKARDRLVKRLHTQRQRALWLLAWYMGEQSPPGMPRDATGELYRRIRESSRNTWAALIVDSIAERLEVQGYRSAAGDRGLDARVWAILQANRIDDEQLQVYVDALLTGRGYVLVLPDADDPETPIVTAESPLEVVHEWRAGGRRRIGYGLKVLELEPGLWRAELYSDDYLFTWEADAGDDRSLDPFLGDRAPWAGEPMIAENELELVPLVPFENRRTTSTGPLSEVGQVVNVLHRIDELLAGRQVAAHFAAFRQRWASGLEVPRDPATGKPIEPFAAAVSKLWVSEEPDARFGSFEATDLGQYTKAIEAEVAELAAISKVPSYYFLQSELANPPSADSLTAGESGLVKKCGARTRTFGESWEAVARLALLAGGDNVAPLSRSDEILWAPVAVRSESQVADAATKRKAVGVPDEALWEFLGATPQEMDAWRALKAEQDLRAIEAALAGVPPTPALPGPPAAE